MRHRHIDNLAKMMPMEMPQCVCFMFGDHSLFAQQINCYLHTIMSCLRLCKNS